VVSGTEPSLNALSLVCVTCRFQLSLPLDLGSERRLG